MNYLSDNAYLAIKPEATAGVAVIPTIFVPLVSENLKTVVNHSVDRRMKGNLWQGNDLLRGNRMHEGEIVILADPDNLGHILNMVMTKGSTTGDVNGYTHPFTTGDGDSYTFEIKKGLYAQRYFGVKVDEVRISFQDGQMQLTLSVKAMGQFSVATLGAALSGSVTSLILDDEYDIAPNRGLVVGDIIDIGGTAVTLTSVNSNGIGLGFTSTSLTFSVGEQIFLKPLTVSNPTLQDPLYLGNCLVGFGADATAAATAAGSRTTATPVYDLEISLKKNLFSKNGSSRFDPVQIVPQTPECEIKLSTLMEDEVQRQKFLDRTKQAMVIVAYGKFIKSDFTTQEKCTFTFNKVKLIENENKLEVGSLIQNDETFAVLYDDSDAAAMTVSLINRSAGTVY